MSHTFAPVTPPRRHLPHPHPFASSSSTCSPPRPRTRPAFPFTDVSNIAYSSTSSTIRIPSPPPPPTSPIPPVPALALAKSFKAPRRAAHQPRTPSPPTRVPFSAPVPLSSPPPPVYEPVVESSRSAQLESRNHPELLRPDSRIQRERRKTRKVGPWDLKHIRAACPARKGLYTVYEVDEDWERITEELQRRPVTYAQLAPFLRTNPSTPRRVPSPINMQLSAKPSSEVLVPSRPLSAQSDGAEAMEVLTDSDSTVNNVVTPQMEDEDPFALDGAWESPTRSTHPSNVPALCSSSPPREKNGRRPPPLTLASSHKTHPSSYSSIILAEGDDDHSLPITPSPIPDSLPPALLSPIALASPGVRQARRRSASGPPDATPPRPKRPSKADQFGQPSPVTPLDLESALEDFLTCCGERSADLEASSSDSDSDDTDLFYRRPKSTAYATSSSSDSDNDLAVAFPLPPARDYTPRSASSTKSSLRSPASFGLGIDMGSPLFSPLSPGPETPRTPPSGRSQLLPSLPIVPSESRPKTTRPETRLPSNHSFLQSLSRGDDMPPQGGTMYPGSPASVMSSVGSSSSRSGSVSSGGSARSSGSGKSLPKRKGIPAGWKAFAATNRI